MHNIIIEDKFDAHGNIVNLNVMFVPEINMIIDKTVLSRPDSQSGPNGGSEPGSGRETELGLFTCFFFLKAELVPVGIQTIFVITKIIYIYKRTTTGVVSINIHTNILSLIYLYIYKNNFTFQLHI